MHFSSYRTDENKELVPLDASLLVVVDDDLISKSKTFSLMVKLNVVSSVQQKNKSCQETNNLINNRCPCRIECTRNEQVIKYSI